jgi:hypothetical protein
MRCPFMHLRQGFRRHPTRSRPAAPPLLPVVLQSLDTRTNHCQPCVSSRASSHSQPQLHSSWGFANFYRHALLKSPPAATNLAPQQSEWRGLLANDSLLIQCEIECTDLDEGMLLVACLQQQRPLKPANKRQRRWQKRLLRSGFLSAGPLALGIGCSLPCTAPCRHPRDVLTPCLFSLPPVGVLCSGYSPSR